VGRRKYDACCHCPWAGQVGGFAGAAAPPFVPNPCQVPLSDCTNGLCFDINFVLIAVVLLFCLGPVKC
jgi:hypothetical protein